MASGSDARSIRGSRVNVPLIATSLPERAHARRSSGRNRANSSAAASRSSGRLPSMLPETSSITMSRMGWGVLSNRMIGCGLPLSRTSKSPCVSVVTSRPSRSVTVANTRTASPRPRNTGACCAPARDAPSTHTARMKYAIHRANQSPGVPAGGWHSSHTTRGQRPARSIVPSTRPGSGQAGTHRTGEARDPRARTTHRAQSARPVQPVLLS